MNLEGFIQYEKKRRFENTSNVETDLVEWWTEIDYVKINDKSSVNSVVEKTLGLKLEREDEDWIPKQSTQNRGV